MATETDLSSLKPTFRPPSKQSSHETTSPRRPINILRLASLCLIGLITSLGDIAPIFVEESPFDPQTISTTLLPTTIGTILAAAFLPSLAQLTQPPTQHQRQHPHTPRCTLPTLLSLTTLATTSLHILITSLTIPTTTSPTFTAALPPQTNNPLLPLLTTLAIHLLHGFTGACTLALTMLLSGGGTRLHAVCASGALGAVLRALACGVVVGGVVGEGGDGGGWGEVRHGGGLVDWAVWWWWVGEMVLALVAAGGLVLPGYGYVRWSGEEGVVVVGEDGRVGAEMGLSVVGDGGGYPPPASRATIFGALFAFAYHAATAAIPSGLDSLAAHGRNTAIGQSLPMFTTAALWAGIAVGRFVALLWSVLIRPKQGVRRAVLGAGGLLLLFWLLPDLARNAAVAAGLIGAVLGPVYPCVVGSVMGELGEEEMLGGLSIIVAFGHSGTMSALLITQLAAYMNSPMALYLVIAMLFGGMLVFWEALTGRDDGGVVSDRRGK